MVASKPGDLRSAHRRTRQHEIFWKAKPLRLKHPRDLGQCVPAHDVRHSGANARGHQLVPALPPGRCHRVGCSVGASPSACRGTTQRPIRPVLSPLRCAELVMAIIVRGPAFHLEVGTIRCAEAEPCWRRRFRTGGCGFVGNPYAQQSLGCQPRTDLDERRAMKTWSGGQRSARPNVTVDPLSATN